MTPTQNQKIWRLILHTRPTYLCRNANQRQLCHKCSQPNADSCPYLQGTLQGTSQKVGKHMSSSYTMCSMEDLRIIKLFQYLLEGILVLAINFLRTCLYQPRFEYSPDSFSTRTLNPFTNLGMLVFRISFYHQDWLKLILTIRSRIFSGKSKFLSLIRE